METSSPDPLTNPLKGFNYPVPVKRSNSVTPKKPLATANGNIRLQDFYLHTPPAGAHRLSSPTISIAQTENLVSPWRIRVTVEAEKDEGLENQISPTMSPAKRLKERRTTTTIPLKGADDSSPAKPKRGRPRKSLDTPLKPVKRNGTPKPKSLRQKSKDDEVDNGKGVPSKATAISPKKTRGRPRKSLGESSILIDSVKEDGDELEVVPSMSKDDEPERVTTPHQKSKGRRKAITPINPVVGSDTNLSFAKAQGLVTQSEGVYQEADEDIERRSVSSPGMRSQDGGRSPFDPTNHHHEFDSVMESEGFSMVSVSSLPSARQHMNGLVEFQGAEIASERLPDTRERKALEGSNMHSGEASFPSRPRQRPLESSSTALLIHGESTNVNSSNVGDTQPSPSVTGNLSQIYQPIKQTTPSQVYSSPSLPLVAKAAPSALSPRSLDKSTGATPKLVRVVRAGIALQGVLSPHKSTQYHKQQQNEISSTVKSPKDRLDDIFSGFGAGTRRELKAGLRLGEELAKRHELALKAAAAVQESFDDVFQDTTTTTSYPELPIPVNHDSYTLSLPVTQREVEYPPLPSQQLPSPDRTDEDDNEDRMSWKADTPVRPLSQLDQDLQGSVQSQHVQSQRRSQIFDTTMEAREAEWQLEREAVSRQIQEANSSQVIVIGESTLPEDDQSQYSQEENEIHEKDEDFEAEEEEEDTDIWQIEAHSSEIQQNTSGFAPVALFAEGVVKPRRSKLPSPWRRNSEMVYSDEASPAEEDVFWQPDLKHSRTPIEDEARKRRRYEASEYSLLSDFVGEPIDQSSPTKKRVFTCNDENENILTSVEEKSPVHDTSGSLTSPVARSMKNDACEESETFQEDSRDSETFRAQHPDVSLASMRPDSTPKEHQDVAEPKSWFSLISSYIPSIGPLMPTFRATPAIDDRELASIKATYAYLLPPKVDLSIYRPWETVHMCSLQAMYVAARHNPTLYPFNRRSPNRHHLGKYVASDDGWKKKNTELEIGTADAFLDVLNRQGTDDGEVDEHGKKRRRIDAEFVLWVLTCLWIGQVQRLEVPLGDANVAGAFYASFVNNRQEVLDTARRRRRHWPHVFAPCFEYVTYEWDMELGRVLNVQ